MDVRVTHTSYLVALLTDASMSAGRLLDVDEERRHGLVVAARREAARLSARLDGSPLEPATADAVDAGRWQHPAVVADGGRVGGWAGALRLDGMATQEVAAVEYANLLAAYDEEARLAGDFFDQPLKTLAQLHGLICEALVDPDVVGRLRTTEQAIHDGAQGRVIYNTPDPARLPELLGELEAWLRGDAAEGSTAFSAPVVAAVVHELLLEWQPYEAANGRVARAAARLVLRARGFDPSGLAVPERVWAGDPGTYYVEVAATIRRRGDLTVWAEHHTEALAEALSAAVDAVHAIDVPPLSDRALGAVDELAAGQSVTVAQYAQRWKVSRETAWSELRALARSGHVERESAALGRRYRRL